MPFRFTDVWTPPRLAAACAAIACTACTNTMAVAPVSTPVPKRPVTTSTSSTIVSFSVSNENLNVDRVSMRDGLLRPDGVRDLAFSAQIDGPFEALFVVSTNRKGEPVYGLLADTLSAREPLPSELGTVADTGRMTVGIGVVENGRFINGESGSAHGTSGVHTLKLYVPNPATLQPSSFVRLYLRSEEGVLVAGPIAPY